MNPCELFKELILVDYLDGELKEDTRQRLEAHLSTCAECLQFVQEVKNKTATPFKNAERKNVPDSVWIAVKEKIGQEQAAVERERPREHAFQSFWERFLSLRLIPVYGIILFICIFSFVIQSNQIKQAKEEEQAQYLAYIIEPNVVFDVENQDEILLEQYFL